MKDAQAEFLYVEYVRTYSWANSRPAPPAGELVMAEWLPTLQAARNLCIAECDAPFADRTAACRRYFERVSEPEQEPDFALRKLPEEAQSLLKKYKNEADKWLAEGTATGDTHEVRVFLKPKE